MYKFFTAGFAAILACSVATAVPLAQLAYANAPLYAPGSSSQIDIRNNFDGTLSSYATAPFNYAGPLASRYVSGLPAAPLAVPAPAPLALSAPLAVPAPLAAAPAPLAMSAPLAAQAPFLSRLATPFAAPFAAAPLSAPLAAPVVAPAPLFG